MPGVLARGGVCAMSRRICRAELAITSGGELLLNVAALDAPLTPEGLIAEARRQRGAVFVGIVLGGGETRKIVREVGPVLPNVTTGIAGRRIWRGKGCTRARGRRRAPGRS